MNSAVMLTPCGGDTRVPLLIVVQEDRPSSTLKELHDSRMAGSRYRTAETLRQWSKAGKPGGMLPEPLRCEKSLSRRALSEFSCTRWYLDTPPLAGVPTDRAPCPCSERGIA